MRHRFETGARHRSRQCPRPDDIGEQVLQAGAEWCFRRPYAQLGYDRIDVAGVSWGGSIAQQFAYQYPQVCRRLILAAAAPGVIMVPGKLSVLWKMASPRRYVDQNYMHSIAAEIYGGNLREDPSLIHTHAENMKGPSNLGYLYQLLALAGWTSLYGCTR